MPKGLMFTFTEPNKPAIHNLLMLVRMLYRDDRYYRRYDGSIRRNPGKKPLLHNGKKPR